ncbi:MAG: hypothetical protein LBQ23_01515 [Puniceicoccales bacterium]|jgi:hypothetical protein|nr:hypothetical protein [Puniceicoccales bacterium]
MSLVQYFNYDSMIELSSSSFRDALSKMLSVGDFGGNIDVIASELEAKEHETSSYIENGVLILHLRRDFSSPYEIYIG